MARFIAVPKQDTAMASLNRGSVQFTRKARRGQVNALIERRQEVDGTSTRAQIESLQGSEIARAANPDFPILPVTGIVVLDADEDQLSSIRDAMPQYDLIEDVPLTLVRPVKASAVSTAAGALDTWHLEATQVTRARNSGFIGRGEGVGVAVLDTGIEEVAEIKGRVVSAYKLDPATQNPVSLTPTIDTDGHGTHVAGTIAGRVVGIAPAADLMNYIMIPNGFGNLSDFVYAVEFVATRPEISILNMSAGIHGYNAGMKQAISTALAVGVLPVVAIGNEGKNSSRSPGNYNESLSIGASTKFDGVANFSGGGTMLVNAQSYTVPDLVAPGQEITSCVMGGGYEAWDGTSMATPVVSGLAALIVERYPTITEPDLRAEIHDALRKLPNIPEQQQGEGLAQLPNHMWFGST